MYRQTGFEEIDEHSEWLVKHKAEQLVGHYGFTESDVEDVKQDLTIHLMVRLRSYDSSRGARTTFVESVLNNKIRSIIKEDRQSGSYDHRLVSRSLDEPVAMVSEEGLALGEMLSLDSITLLNGGTRSTVSERSDLRIDLGHALSAMTPEMRELCAKLAEGSIADIVRETGIPRYRVQWLRTRIRRVFLRFCLDEYC